MTRRNRDQQNQQTKEEILRIKHIEIGKIYSLYARKIITEEQATRRFAEYGVNFGDAKAIYENIKGDEYFNVKGTSEKLRMILLKLNKTLNLYGRNGEFTSVRRIKTGIEKFDCDLAEMLQIYNALCEAAKKGVNYDATPFINDKEQKVRKTTIREIAGASEVSDRMRQMGYVDPAIRGAEKRMKAAEKIAERKKEQLSHGYDSHKVRVSEYIERESDLVQEAIKRNEKELNSYSKGHLSSDEAEQLFRNMCDWLLEQQRLLDQMIDSKYAPKNATKAAKASERELF